MITVERLEAITDVVTHANCPDGIATAILIYDVLPHVNFHFLQYNTNEYREFNPGPNQLWCDFSPLPARNQEFVDAKAIVLDHHKGAAGVVAAYGSDGVFADESLEPGVCGATLAFREVWMRLKVGAGSDEIAEARYFTRLAGIRDTFQTSDPSWIQACEQAEVLRFMPLETWLIRDPFVGANLGWWRSRRALGKVLVEKHTKSVDRAIRGAYEFKTSRGTKVRFFSGNSPITSDAAESLGHSSDLVVGFSFVGLENGLAKIAFSTRSHTGYDCLALCSSLGGGGHTKAAGFAISFAPGTGTQDPYSLFELAVERHEAARASQAVQP